MGELAKCRRYERKKSIHNGSIVHTHTTSAPQYPTAQLDRQQANNEAQKIHIKANLERYTVLLCIHGEITLCKHIQFDCIADCLYEKNLKQLRNGQNNKTANGEKRQKGSETKKDRED